ncbi:MAG TPA: ABC transporter substrate-binding protein, partial [Acidimicrobiia bacterium]|nr:ABC transporter substrate-binding protein [Acidimicrobiia bacterium]
MRRPKWIRLLGVVLALTMVAAACGDDDDDAVDAGGEGGGEEIESVPGFDGETIRLGVITPTTGPVAVIGNPLTEGNKVYWESVNAQGGVAGRYPVELEIVDSKYDAPTAVQQYNRIKNDVVMFNQLLGTPIVNALREQLTDDNIVGQPASLDAFWVRVQHLLPIGGPYQIQAINAMDWVVNQGGLTGGGEGGGEDEGTTGRAQEDAPVICFAGHDDPYGDAGKEGLDFAAEELGFEIAADVRFEATA